jgi:3-dehydroquinate synthase
LLGDINGLLSPYCSDRSTLVVTDSNVDPLYFDKLKQIDNTNSNKFVFPAGEQHKNIETVTNICRKAVECGLDRKSLLIALGGGVCGDMAGFAAAIYMRGVDFIQVPTTLLAMVDSSVGGKTGVDIPEGKNLIGAFWQPNLVVIDPETLKTLPREELQNGLAEVVKYGMIQDWDFFQILENNLDSLNNLDMEFYTGIIKRCCKLKAEVVAQDEREGGLRAILNYGHTFGHAVELLSDFSIAHGSAVAIGMSVAAELAVMTGKISKDLAERQNNLLTKLGLPTKVPKTFDSKKIHDAMLHDKKTVGSKIKLILPDSEGSVEITAGVESKLILEAVENCHD